MSQLVVPWVHRLDLLALLCTYYGEGVVVSVCDEPAKCTPGSLVMAYHAIAQRAAPTHVVVVRFENDETARHSLIQRMLHPVDWDATLRQFRAELKCVTSWQTQINLVVTKMLASGEDTVRTVTLSPGYLAASYVMEGKPENALVSIIAPVCQTHQLTRAHVWRNPGHSASAMVCTASAKLVVFALLDVDSSATGLAFDVRQVEIGCSDANHLHVSLDGGFRGVHPDHPMQKAYLEWRRSVWEPICDENRDTTAVKNTHILPPHPVMWLRV